MFVNEGLQNRRSWIEGGGGLSKSVNVFDEMNDP